MAITLRLQLCSARFTVLDRKTVEEVPLQQYSHHENMTIRTPPTINYCLESAAAITLRFQLFSAHYTALQMKNNVRIVSAIYPVTTKNTDDSHLQTYCREAMHRTTANRHLGLSEMGHKQGQR